MKNNWIKALTFSLLLLGILLSLQYSTQQEAVTSLAYQKIDDLVAFVRELNTRRSSLEDQYAEVTKNLNTLRASGADEKNAILALEKENTSLKIIDGLTSVSGSGITLTFNSKTFPLATDIIDINNELWLTGAEAIAVNKIRITQATTISTIKGTNNITANGEDIGSPIVIKAIGDPAALEKGVTFPGGIIDKLSTMYNITPEITKSKKLILPAAV